MISSEDEDVLLGCAVTDGRECAGGSPASPISSTTRRRSLKTTTASDTPVNCSYTALGWSAPELTRLRRRGEKDIAPVPRGRAVVPLSPAPPR
jgi:hypothetical protein